METKENENKSNLPEEGAQDVNNEKINNEINEEATSKSVEEHKEEKDAATEKIAEQVANSEVETPEPEKVEEVKEPEFVEGKDTKDIEKPEPVENKEAGDKTEVVEATEPAEDKKVEEKAEDATKNDTESIKEAGQSIEEKNETVSKTETKEAEKPVDEPEANDKKPEEKKFEREEYSTFDRPVLLSKLNTLINNYKVEIIREAVEEIKTAFYKQYKIEVAEAKKEFIDKGGVPEEFKFSDESSEDTFKVLYSQFREKKALLNQKLEKEKTENLKIKYEIIDKIKELINKEESINKTFHEFRELQQQWRETGLVPQNSVKNLWENYNHTVEKFYDYININKELRDLDLKKNLEMKIELCEKAEALLLVESITKAFRTLQEYHNQWREIGPVPHDQKDDIWERFKSATTQINKKHQDYFEGLKEQQIKNLEQKTALCERVDEILTAKIEKPKGWEEKAKELIEIQKLWRTIGFAPKKDNNRIYQRFKDTCDNFFAQKREFYKEAKEVQKNNLQLKLDLCVQAEALKDSTEWRKTTEDFINLQKKWKEIGPVPKKHSETLWKRFRSTCDFFFNKKSDFYNAADSRQEDNLKLKLDLIEKVKNFKKADDDKQSLKLLMDIQKEWTDVGHVPLNKKDEIQKQFREAINAQFEVLKIDDGEREKLNFKTKVDNWVSTNSMNKIYSERSKLAIKLKELENEIALYENNIGFFSKSKNSESLLEEVTRKIEKAKERIKTLKQKIRMLDKADN